MSKCEVYIPEKKENITITNDFLTTEKHQNVNIYWKTLKFILFFIGFIILIGCLSCLIKVERRDHQIFLFVRRDSIQVKKIDEFTSNKNDSEKESEIPVINIRINPTNPQNTSLNEEKTDEKMKNVEKGNPLGSDSLIKGNFHETTEKISTTEDIPHILNPHNIFNSGFLNRPALLDIFHRVLRNRLTQNIDAHRFHLPTFRKVFLKTRPEQENEIKSTEKPLNNLPPFRQEVHDIPFRFMPFNFINSLSHFQNKLSQSDNYESDPESEDSEDDKIKMMDCSPDSEIDESEESLSKMINNRRYIYQGLPEFNSESVENQPIDKPIYPIQAEDILGRFNSENVFRSPFNFLFKKQNEDDSQNSDSKSEDSSDESISNDNIKKEKTSMDDLSIPTQSVEFGK